jgi:outer membrane receptor protein involved in Fe transport
MKRSTLASAIYTALALTAFSTVAFAQDSAPATAQDEDTTEIDEVVVTGSLIPQAMKDTASPVTTITAEDIQRQGFRDVADVLRSQPMSTGSLQDGQFPQGFTPGAQTVSLLGLAPGFTLILLDGRPMADYPLLYNGQANFTDLTSIPTTMVERIDILPGNQSAIYGSAAIAGVINIILKKNLDGMQFGARLGNYTEGGGDNMRFQFSGGKTWDRFDISYGLQYSQNDPIFGYDRAIRDSTNDVPCPAASVDPTSGDCVNQTNNFGSRTFLILNGFNNRYRDPTVENGGVDPCPALAANFDGTTQRDFRPGRGSYCGSRAEPGYSTILNEQKGLSVYTQGNFQLSDNATLYGSLLLGKNDVTSNSGSRFWIPDINGSGGFVWIPSRGRLDEYQHIFSPEETGAHTSDEHNDTRQYNLAFGIKGTLGSSDWDYDAYYARSAYRVKNSQLWPLAGPIEDFFRNQFLGPQGAGYTNPDGTPMLTYYGYPVYEPDNSAFYQSLTPAEYASFLGQIESVSTTWTHSFNFQTTNTNLFETWAGPVGFAALVTGGYQTWNNPTDQRVINHEFWGLTGTQGAGKRRNEAIATEFRIPLADRFQANLSARYDRYKNIDAGSDSKATYKLGLEIRPIDELLIRGNYATAFRAPDMSYIYAGESGFFSTATDYYRCGLEEPDVDIGDCSYSSNQQYQGSRIGNLNLKSITANSYGLGAVWSPTRNFELRADYYNISIDNEVSDISVDALLQTEAQCRLGGLDPTSPTCLDAFERIIRNPPGGFQGNALREVHINPINISKERVSGIVAAMTYRWDIGRAGNLTFNVDYNTTLTHESQQYPGDPVLDLLHDGFQSSEFKSVLTGDVTWEIGRFTTAVHGTRFGETPNFAEQVGTTNNNGYDAGDVGAHMLYNLNFNYEITPNQDISLTVNNVFDTMPPVDKSWTTYPYYNNFNYNSYGRAMWLEYRIDVGGSDE